MKTIELYPNYAATKNGEIISLERYDSLNRKIPQRVLKPKLDKHGYLRVTLSLGNRKNQKCCLVSRLIALTFLPNPNNLSCVNHIDGNKLNNSVENLEWISSGDNTRHAWDLGLCKPYDRSQPYNREGIISSNKARRKWFGTHKEYCKAYYEKKKLEKISKL